MTILSKSPASPEMIAAMKADGQTVVAVTVTRYYILHTQAEIPALMQEWFVKYRGSSHAYRDGSHVGGADVVQQIKNLTTNEIVSQNEDHQTPKAPPNWNNSEAAAWESGYEAGRLHAP